MGWKKFFKKVTRAVTKPVSKVFKGVARGIKKVGSSVMRGVARISKKLGPVGMIALSMAMPYALSGLSSMVGTAGVGAYGGVHAGTGMMSSSNLFIRSIGNMGNIVRTGYQAATGAISTGMNTITKSMSKAFSKLANPTTKGGNIWSRISNGAKNLYNSAKATLTGQQKTGLVDVTGVQPNIHGSGAIQTSMKSVDAAKLIGKEGISFSGQTTGFASSASDKLITETINNATQSTLKTFDSNSMKYFNDLKGTGRFTNNQEVIDSMLSNKGTVNNFGDGSNFISTDLSQTGDYTLGTARDRLTESSSPVYNFNGGKTFDTPVAKEFGFKDKLISKATSTAKKYFANSLFSKSEPLAAFQPADFVFTQGAENNANGTGASLSSTDIKGSGGSSDYAKVFGTEAWTKLKNYHKNMNYQGEQDYYGG
tara:strand:- start:386 stop:1657 length:1272 start_codon:yes stop_codon:yes gene_type:complete